MLDTLFNFSDFALTSCPTCALAGARAAPLGVLQLPRSCGQVLGGLLGVRQGGGGHGLGLALHAGQQLAHEEAELVQHRTFLRDFLRSQRSVRRPCTE